MNPLIEKLDLLRSAHYRLRPPFAAGQSGMLRAMPWIIAIFALVAFVAAFSEMQRARARFAEASRFHYHTDVRQFIIKAALDEPQHPIVVIGDSITEMARLPEMIGDKPVVNAGIGGATIGDFTMLALNSYRTQDPRLSSSHSGQTI